MDSAAVLLFLTVTAGTLLHVDDISVKVSHDEGGLVLGTESVSALYGETIVVPCNDGAPAPEDLMFVKWKY
ncbi:CD166 antigen like, partial [Dissostichus eleginoides]